MKQRYYLQAEELPANFVYPASYRSFAEQCGADSVAMLGIPPWIFCGDLLWAYHESLDVFGLRMIPFAQAEQRDLIAYFVVNGASDPQVILTNPWEPNSEFRHYQEFSDFEAWLSFAKTYSAELVAEFPDYLLRPFWFPGSAK